jgi:2-hydroxychromene-2-carboxylate isomerase
MHARGEVEVICQYPLEVRDYRYRDLKRFQRGERRGGMTHFFNGHKNVNGSIRCRPLLEKRRKIA